VSLNQFRLRTFLESLVKVGECEVHDGQTDLIDVAAALEGNPKAVWFKNAGDAGSELCGNVMGSRKRLAMSLGVAEELLLSTLLERFRTPHAPVEILRELAPVQEVVLTGADADFTKLPVHLQHGEDGAPYISASIDFCVNPLTGWTNVGCRRMMLRGRNEAGIDLNAPSDFRIQYQKSVAHNEKLPVAFVVGSHPVDFIGAIAMMPSMDELAVLGAVRGMPVKTVKCVTNDLQVPADAEYILEGYLDSAGLVEPEGPYGEYIGYYGVMKMNPVFHLTAITHRKDAVFQTATIGGRFLANTDTAQLCALRTDATVWAALQTAIREPLAVHTTPSCGGMYNVRISMRVRYPGEPRNAIAAAFGSFADIKHVFVVDDDIDIRSDSQVDWALATRFQADRDLVVGSGFRAVPLDPSLRGSRIGAKAGFDLTKPIGSNSRLEYQIPEPPVMEKVPLMTLTEALIAKPRTFKELMDVRASRDGREIVLELDDLRKAGRLARTDDGRYTLSN
jgi:2,5-furandicarboxylate decarboxylase 1